jgi:hypothetical protein
MAKLKFVLKTGSSSQGGACSDLWVRLIDWSSRESSEVRLHRACDKGFEPGSSETVIIESPRDFGSLAQIEVRRDDVPRALSWQLENIRLTNLDTREEYFVDFCDNLSTGVWFSPFSGLVHRRHVPSAEVFWCARDLSVYPQGNHHFLAVMFRSRDAALFNHPRFLTEQNNGDVHYFITLGGYADGAGKMLYCLFNQEDDAGAFREYLGSGKFLGSWSDMDYESHLIEPLDGKSEQDLSLAIIQAGRNFMMHEKRPEASKAAGNCAMFVNSLLASIGYPSEYRQKRGLFWVSEPCDELLMDAACFFPPG